MADERYTFAQARARLEEIVTQVRKKDVSLEKSLDLLEEGVKLANVCTELSDHTEWRSVAEEQREAEEDAGTGDAGSDAAQAVDSAGEAASDDAGEPAPTEPVDAEEE